MVDSDDIRLSYKEKEKKYGAHSHVRATARLGEHIIHSRGQRYVVPLKRKLTINTTKFVINTACLIVLTRFMK